MYKIKFDYNRQNDIETFYNSMAKIIINGFKEKNNLRNIDLSGLKPSIARVTMSRFLTGKLIDCYSSRKNENIKFITAIDFIESVTNSNYTKIFIDGKEIDVKNHEVLVVIVQEYLKKLLSFMSIAELAKSLSASNGNINSWSTVLYAIKNGKEKRHHVFKYLAIIQLSSAMIEIHSDFPKVSELISKPIADLFVN